MSDEKEIKLSKAAQGILDEVKKLSVLELADLVKAMEEEFGVSAAALALGLAVSGCDDGGRSLLRLFFGMAKATAIAVACWSLVPGPRIELGTPGFSVRCSTS